MSGVIEPPIVVLGMHRSGTSAAAGLLAAAGAWLGDPSELLPANEANAAGYYERARLVLCTDLLLEARGCSWHNPYDEGLLRREYRDHEVALLSEHLLASARGARGVPAVVKDPRLSLYAGLFTRPGWAKGMVVCLRDPVAVARSLHRVHNLPVITGLALWELYMSCLTQGLDQVPVTVFHYEQALVDLDYVSAFVEAVGLPCAALEEPTLATAMQHFEPGDGDDLLTGHQRDAWQRLRTAAGPLLPEVRLSDESADLLRGRRLLDAERQQRLQCAAELR